MATSRHGFSARSRPRWSTRRCCCSERVAHAGTCQLSGGALQRIQGQDGAVVTAGAETSTRNAYVPTLPQRVTVRLAVRCVGHEAMAMTRAVPDYASRSSGCFRLRRASLPRISEYVEVLCRASGSESFGWCAGTIRRSACTAELWMVRGHHPAQRVHSRAAATGTAVLVPSQGNAWEDVLPCRIQAHILSVTPMLPFRLKFNQKHDAEVHDAEVFWKHANAGQSRLHSQRVHRQGSQQVRIRRSSPENQSSESWRQRVGVESGEGGASGRVEKEEQADMGMPMWNQASNLKAGTSGPDSGLLRALRLWTTAAGDLQCQKSFNRHWVLVGRAVS
eukprot:366450-Chlamydomonas_euryale.AAC.39